MKTCAEEDASGGALGVAKSARTHVGHSEAKQDQSPGEDGAHEATDIKIDPKGGRMRRAALPAAGEARNVH